MIRFSVLLFVALFSMHMSAQVLPEGVEIKLGTEFSTSGKKVVKRIVTQVEGKTLIYTRENNELEFLLFDEELAIIHSNKVVLASGKKQLSFVRVVETESGIYVFSTLHDNFLNREVLYYQEINTVTLTVSSAKILHSKGYNSQAGAISFFIEVSPNKKFLMVDVTSIKSNSSDDIGLESFDILVFNKKFDRVWREDGISLTDDEERIFRDKRRVTNQGKVTLMSLQITGDLEDIETADDILSMFDYYLVVLSEGKEHVVYELNLESGYFADLNYEIGPDGKVYVLAVSYDKEEEERAWYFTVLDIDSGVFVVESKSDFVETTGVLFDTGDPDDEVIKLLSTSPYVTAGTELNANISIGRIYVDSYGVTVTFESSASGTGYYQKYKSLVGIGVAKFSLEGEQLWSQGVQKIQFPIASVANYTSCGVLYSSGSVSYVFNFTPMNKTNGNINEFAWSSNKPADLYMSTIDKSGDVRTNLLLKGGKKPYWMPALAIESETKELILVGFYGKNNKLAKLSVK